MQELGTDITLVGNFLKSMCKTVDEYEKTNLSVLENFMKNKARSLRIQPVKITLSDLEKKAAKITVLYPNFVCQIAVRD